MVQFTYSVEHEKGKANLIKQYPDHQKKWWTEQVHHFHLKYFSNVSVYYRSHNISLNSLLSSNHGANRFKSSLLCQFDDLPFESWQFR